MVKILELLEECLKAKESGVDCFFEYAPHVGKVEVRIYKKGWENEKMWDRCFSFYLVGLDEKAREEIIIDCMEYIERAMKNEKD